MKTISKPPSVKTAPAPKGKPSVRLPQRSETISGDEAKGDITPIAAAQKKKTGPK
jgi:hypothetical protein